MNEFQTFFKAPKGAPRRRAPNSTLPYRSGKETRVDRQRKQRAGVTPNLRAVVWRNAGGRCQADGLHHPDCPGRLPHGDWVPHHVLPREHDGPDTAGNLIAVWCPMGLGWNGCHGRIHGRPAEAKRLELLKGPCRH